MYTCAEAEYADLRKKKMIPVRLQAGYMPEDWLGLLLGSKLYFDFSNQETFDDKMKELLKEIRSTLKRANSGLHVQSVQPFDTSGISMNSC